MRSTTLAASSCRAALQRASYTPTQTIITKRTFTSLPTLRPSLAARNPVFRSATNTLARLPSTPDATTTATATTTDAGVVADIVPKSSITSHPAFIGSAFQIRCGPRPNLERSSRLIRKRRSGFLARQRSQTGRKILQRRRVKGRRVLSM
ncbi:uncharacterized protein B0I36DRAFT_362101 [Microdochium trichocladiopsis]|uniref:Ribosomal protein L34-domain-containing protein n=1 Tax=Microdochium trichocladiopsis TaxID=1682393 RepID=A0A9P8Y773_9PEZI|nr:uncharacterized protein B0I36DRAFT_362101 [Microdochium trichocladiopsis]KAH7033435.1 hypothetical protein B0I36DRAFT_362101 [Microdochium trichocladiopsis]